MNIDKDYITDVKTDRQSLEKYANPDNPDQARRMIYALSIKIKEDKSIPIELRTSFARKLRRIALIEGINANKELGVTVGRGKTQATRKDTREKIIQFCLTNTGGKHKSGGDNDNHKKGIYVAAAKEHKVSPSTVENIMNEYYELQKSNYWDDDEWPGIPPTKESS